MVEGDKYLRAGGLTSWTNLNTALLAGLAPEALGSNHDISRKEEMAKLL
jgi:hypothetical protein